MNATDQNIQVAGNRSALSFLLQKNCRPHFFFVLKGLSLYEKSIAFVSLFYWVLIEIHVSHTVYNYSLPAFYGGHQLAHR